MTRLISSPEGRIAMAAARLAALRRRLRTTSLPELFVLLLAALPRLWRLEYHSIWFDEAVSLDWARLGPAHIWPGTFQLLRDKHPPAYYLALHYWQTFLSWFGVAERDAALRIFGVLIGILLVWGVLRLVTRLSGRATALLAGAFTALAPVLVWYSQELRMFLPAAAAIVWAAFFLVAARDRHSPQPASLGRSSAASRILYWFGLAAALVFALYSYLYAAFFLPGLGLTVFLLARRLNTFNRRYILEAVAAFAFVILLFLPLARSAWTVNRASSTPGAPFADFLPNLWRQLHIFTVWYSGWPSSVRTAAILFFALLVLAGLVLPGDRRRDTRPLLWLWIGAPLLIGSALLATNAAIFREDRYFLFLAPFVLWAAARGVSALGRWQPSAGALSGLAALALLAASLPVLWTPPLFRENWRAAADYISAYQQHSPHTLSAALVHPYFLFPALDWYLRQQPETAEMPVYGNFNAPLNSEQDDTIIADHLQELAAASGADTLWLVQSHLAGVDDQRLVQSWLDGRFPLVTVQYPAGVEMRGYAVRYRYRTLPALSETAVLPQVQLFPSVELAACEIITPVVAARDVVYHPPSGWVHLRLWLRTFEEVSEAPPLYALVQSDDGQIWGRSLEHAGDVLSVFPPTMWQPNEFVRVELDVNLNPAASPGAYSVKVEAEGEPGIPCGSVQLE
ncbi:MAG: hypothetical protein OXI80_11840 [Caldilineaceae bacterium]|nr:hypothetical protein [Caldilineaceae bacterium]MDE0338353.1 hypothetical protein [Caldilineaceae bacterium]